MFLAWKTSSRFVFFILKYSGLNFNGSLTSEMTDGEMKIFVFLCSWIKLGKRIVRLYLLRIIKNLGLWSLNSYFPLRFGIFKETFFCASLYFIKCIVPCNSRVKNWKNYAEKRQLDVDGVVLKAQHSS